MTDRPSFDALRDNIVDSPTFQRACQRYARSNGSSEAIAMAVLTAIGFPDLYIDALRYRFLREHGVLTDAQDRIKGDDVDITVDASMVWEVQP